MLERLLAYAAVTHVMRANSPNAAHQWVRSALVTIEVAVAVVLLVGSGLFLASFARVAGINLGIETRDVLTAGCVRWWGLRTGSARSGRIAGSCAISSTNFGEFLVSIRRRSSTAACLYEETSAPSISPFPDARCAAA